MHAGTLGLALAITAFSFTTAQAQQILPREPAMGAMKEGETVLVDDGKCPKGQIRKVVGGNHVDVGGVKRVRRSSSCIPRP